MLRDVCCKTSKRLIPYTGFGSDSINFASFEIAFIYDPDRLDAAPYVKGKTTLKIAEREVTLTDFELDALIARLETARDLLRECKAEAEQEEAKRNGK